MNALSLTHRFRFFPLTAILVLLVSLSATVQAQTVTVTLTAPSNGASFAVNTPINLAATTTGTVGRVRFKQNGTNVSFGDTTAPYTDTFTPTSAGTYVLLAEAMQTSTVLATSASITITVTGGTNAAPTVSLTSPSGGASGNAPATFSLAATAADSDGSIASVKFYANGGLLSTDTSVPFQGSFASSALGAHSLTAVATDNSGATTTSSAVSVTVTSSTSSSATRTYVYDSAERLCKTINPESGATVVDYDLAGNIAWIAEGTNLTSNTCDRGSVTAGQKTVRTYNSMNRVIAVSTPLGKADSTTTYHADGLVNTLTVANPGGYNVVTTYSYNKRRLLTAETSANGAALYALGYGYSANGHLSTLVYPDNLTVSYAPDALGRATQVAGTIGGVNTTYASAIGYYPNGAISGFTYGNGIVHTMTQNARHLPSRSQDKNGTTAILDDSYVFDGNGNVTDITDQAQAGLTTRGMAYDGLDRLTAAVSPSQWGNATYSYDALDNLRSADQGARQYRYNYDPASNRLLTIKDPAGTNLFTFGYDAQGNTISKGSQALVFDSANRLSEVTGQQVYRYDGQGRRVQTTDADTKTTYWIYSQSGQVLHTAEARRSRNLSYIYLGNTQVATRATAWTTGTVALRYQHTDALGSPVAETDEQRTVTKRNSYAPYGETFAPTAIDGTGYTGHVMDQATGLTYMQQRYYDPQIGRFLSTDPVATRVTGENFNRYRYASNNPFSFVDPDGQDDQHILSRKDYLHAATSLFQLRGAFVLSGHGSPVSRGIQNAQKSGYIPLADVAREGSRLGHYRGQAILALVCGFGAGGANSQAQEYANMTRSPVIATADYAMIPTTYREGGNPYRIGNQITITANTAGDGSGSPSQFSVFLPGGKGPSDFGIKSMTFDPESGKLDITYKAGSGASFRKETVCLSDAGCGQ